MDFFFLEKRTVKKTVSVLTTLYECDSPWHRMRFRSEPCIRSDIGLLHLTLIFFFKDRYNGYQQSYIDDKGWLFVWRPVVVCSQMGQ